MTTNIKCLETSITLTNSPWETLYPLLCNYSYAFLISDVNVPPSHQDPIIEGLLKHPIKECLSICSISEEETKNLPFCQEVWAMMTLHGLDRSSVLITMGGGVLSDTGGFLASCYMRGIDVIHIPTTLMGMVDASIGGKTAVNTSLAKNIIGTFHPPRAVIIDPTIAETLPDDIFRSGLAEAIKYGIIWDEELFSFLENEMDNILTRDPASLQTMISRCCAIKAEIVNQDAKDTGIRTLLNFGHTFAHAIEAATQYNTYSHGEAVAIGLCCAADLSRMNGDVDEPFVERVLSLCEAAGLPTMLSQHTPPEEILSAMTYDKKMKNGQMSFILTLGLGKAYKKHPIPSDTIREVLCRRQVNLTVC